jgi:hypothetical protein
MDIVKRRRSALMTSIHARRTLLATAIVAMILPVASANAQAAAQPSDKPSRLDDILGFGIKGRETGGWLFVGSRGEGEGGIYFALSKDGYNWSFVNAGQPVVRPSERGELMRDPFIQRAPDGTLEMVWTWSKDKPAIGYSSSIDLLHWTKNRQLPAVAAVPGITRASSPAAYYDATSKHWIILWSGSVSAGAGGAAQDRIYATTTTDFKQFTPAKLFFDPGYNVTDAALFTTGAASAQSLLFFEDERSGRIAVAKGAGLDGPWKDISAPFTGAASEAPAAIPVADGLLVYYHHSRDPQEYNAALTKDLQQWSDVSLRTAFPGAMRHGSFLRISAEEYSTLHDFYLRFDTGLREKE